MIHAAMSTLLFVLASLLSWQGWKQPVVTHPRAPRTYYVSPSGNNEHPGTRAHPLLTLSEAERRMVPGDTCLILSGTYREHIATSKSELHFAGYPGEKVVITGLDPVTGWEQYRNGIVKAAFEPEEIDLQPQSAAHLKAKGQYMLQVFDREQLLTQARYPNKTGDDLDWDSHGIEVKIFPDGTFAFQNRNDEIWQREFFAGASFHAIVERKFNAVQATVENFNSGRFRTSKRTAGWQKSTDQLYSHHLFTRTVNEVSGVGKGFITNHLNALDAPGEWHYDKIARELYLKPQDARHSLSHIEARSRKNAFTLTRTSGITISNIQIFAAGIELIECQKTLIQNCAILYPMPYYIHNDEYDGRSMINITGDENKIVNCHIAHAWGSGVIIHSGYRNTIANCLIEDVDWMGTYNACIKAGGKETRITQNTLRSSGRFLIEGIGLSNATIQYNDMYHAMLLGQDGGCFYTYVTDGEKTEIAYNWVHDVRGVPWERSTLAEDHNLTVGIYLDGGCKNYSVHHNLIWDTRYGIVINGNPGKTATGIRIENNTIQSSDVGVLSKNNPLHYSDCSVRNNLSKNKVAVVCPKESNLEDRDMNFDALLERLRYPGAKMEATAHMPIHPKIGAYNDIRSVWTAGANFKKLPASAR
jgi:hypothetical protein